MRGGFLIALLLAATAGAEGRRTARQARVAPSGASSVGPTVTYTTKQRAFLNRGSADGLTTGMVLKLTRGGRSAGQCTVDSAAEHAATCAGKSIQPGDTFKLERTAPTGPQLAKLPPVLTMTETERRQSTLEAQPLNRVEFDASHAHTPLNLGGPVTVTLEHDIWTAFTKPDATFQSERLDVSLQGVDLSHGFRLFVDATAMQWTQVPQASRLVGAAPDPYSSNTVLLVRQTEVDHRVQGDAWVGAIGRIMPAYAPGAPVIDGLQGGWRNSSGTFEIGAFGGLVPDPISLVPATDRWTAGAYAGFRFLGEKSDLIQLYQQSFRVAIVDAPEFASGTRFEAETQAQAWLPKSSSVSGDVRFGFGTGDNAPGFLEAARFDLDVQPASGFRVGGSFRYLNTPSGDVLYLGALTPAIQGTHADLTASWSELSSIAVSAIAGVSDDSSSGLFHGEVGPEVSFPTLLGARGGLAVGYLQEFGWWGQRTAYVQSMLRPIGKLRLVLRALYFEDTPALNAGSFNTRELGFYGDGEMPLTSWLSAHLGLNVRHGLGSDLAGTNPVIRDTSSSGLGASLALTASL